MHRTLTNVLKRVFCASMLLGTEVSMARQSPYAESILGTRTTSRSAVHLDIFLVII